ncbi:hypothetical protein [Lactiplantibacillus pentosus]|nr:hypothetical protein [Lactiplantibacillus pentosus]
MSAYVPAIVSRPRKSDKDASPADEQESTNRHFLIIFNAHE